MKVSSDEEGKSAILCPCWRHLEYLRGASSRTVCKMLTSALVHEVKAERPGSFRARTLASGKDVPTAVKVGSDDEGGKSIISYILDINGWSTWDERVHGISQILTSVLVYKVRVERPRSSHSQKPGSSQVSPTSKSEKDFSTTVTIENNHEGKLYILAIHRWGSACDERVYGISENTDFCFSHQGECGKACILS